MVKTVIFDLDGTLLYTLEDLKDSVNYALSKYNYPTRTIDEIRNFVGNGVKILMERAIPNGLENPDFQNCLTCFKEHYELNMYNKTKIFDGIDNMLDILKNRGYKIAVVSNKFDEAVKELCQKYFSDKIEIAIGESETIRKKPAPDSVIKVMNLFNSDKNLTYYIGDSEVDIQTALNSGVKCISVTWGYKSKEFLQQNNASILVDTPDDILKILL